MHKIIAYVISYQTEKNLIKKLYFESYEFSNF